MAGDNKPSVLERCRCESDLLIYLDVCVSWTSIFKRVQQHIRNPFICFKENCHWFWCKLARKSSSGFVEFEPKFLQPSKWTLWSFCRCCPSASHSWLTACVTILNSTTILQDNLKDHNNRHPIVVSFLDFKNCYLPLVVHSFTLDSF